MCHATHNTSTATVQRFAPLYLPPQGFSNRVLNFALLFETTVALLITYVPPLNTVWSTRPLNVVYLFVGVPYFIFIFAYDELRKLAIRRKPGGWVDRNAYW